MNDNTIDTRQGMDGQTVTTFQAGRPAQAPADIPRVTIGNIQGVTRYTVGEETQQPPEPPAFSMQSGRIGDGLTRFTAGQRGGIESGSITRQTATDLAPASSGILGTLRNNAGFPTGSIGPNCTVELPGMGRTSVKVAANLGFLALTVDGRYVEAGAPGNAEGGPRQGSAQEQQAAINNNGNTQEQQADEGPALFATTATGNNLEEAYGNLIEPIQQATYDSMLAAATAYLTQDGGLDGLIDSLAGRFGSDLANDYSALRGEDIAIEGDAREQTAAAIRAGAEMWQHQADTHVKAAGIVPADFYEWARESSPDALKQAIQGQLFGRSLKGYTDLMNSYFDNVPPTLEALQRGGIPTKEQGGKTFVQLGGSWMTLDAAVKARLV